MANEWLTIGATTSGTVADTVVSVKDYGALGDVVQIGDGVMSSGSAILTSASAPFGAARIGQYVGVRGAGSGSDRVITIRRALPFTFGTTDSMSPMSTSLDGQGATKIKAAITGTESVTWELWGSNDASFAGEVVVYGPANAVKADGDAGGRDTVTISSPVHRYYRAKVRSYAIGVSGNAYASIVAYGRFLSATIASIQSSSQVTLSVAAGTTVSGAWAFFGTDDTTAIQAANAAVRDRVSGADRGGQVFFPHGHYLITNTVTQSNKVSFVGEAPYACGLYVDPGRFPTTANTPALRLGEPGLPAYSSTVRHMSVWCNNALGSVGIFSGSTDAEIAVNSFSGVQENSGIDDVAVVEWANRGVWFKYFSCQNFKVIGLTSYAGDECVGDDTKISLALELIVAPKELSQMSVFASCYFGGYGTCVLVDQSEAHLSGIHTECGRYGIRFTSGSFGSVRGHTPTTAIIQGNVCETSNPVVFHDAGSSIVNTTWNRKFIDNVLATHSMSGRTQRIMGFGGGQAQDILQVIGSSAATRFDKKGRIIIDGGVTGSPNIIAHSHLNFGGSAQGGHIGVNTVADSFPNFTQTSDRIPVSVDPSTDTLTLSYWPTTGLRRTDAEKLNDVWGWTLGNGTAFYVVDALGAGTNNPGGLVFGTIYYTVNTNSTAKTTQLSLTPGGAAVDITSAGTGQIYLTEYPYAFNHQMGASRYMIRASNATNQDGTLPGYLIAAFDRTFGTIIRHLWFQAGAMETALGDGFLYIGNTYAANRARLSHGETSQVALTFQNSADSGSSWTEILTLLLNKTAVFTPWLFFDAAGRGALKIGNDYGANRARIVHTDSGQVHLRIERSADSGGSWSTALEIDLSTGVVSVPSLTASAVTVTGLTPSRPVLTDAGSTLSTAKIDMTNINHVSGAVDNRVAMGNTAGQLKFVAPGENQPLFYFAASGFVAAPATLTNPLHVTGSTANRVAFGSSGALSFGKVDLSNGTDHVTVPGSSGDILANGGFGVSTYSPSSLASTLLTHMYSALDSRYAPLVHDHDLDYAAVDHTHSTYADAGHSHSEYASVGHTH